MGRLSTTECTNLPTWSTIGLMGPAANRFYF